MISRMLRRRVAAIKKIFRSDEVSLQTIVFAVLAGGVPPELGVRCFAVVRADFLAALAPGQDV